MRQLKITRQITSKEEKSINFYFSEVSQYPLLSAEEEVNLSEKIKQGDSAALNKLVTANLRFVISVAKQYQNQGLTLSDLINEGNIGLIISAQRFDHTRGFKFISYAVWWIRQSIMQALSENARMVRLPGHRILLSNKIKRANIALEQTFERAATIDELADYIEISEEEIKSVLEDPKPHSSYDAPITPDSQHAKIELIESPFPNFYEEQAQEDDNRYKVKKLLETLPARDADILRMTYGIGYPQPLNRAEISDKIGVSVERIRQINLIAVKKLKQTSKCMSNQNENL